MTIWTNLSLEAERGLRANVRTSLSEWAALALAAQGQVPARHHRMMIGELEAVALGSCDRLMLLLPPGSAKSTYAFQDNWTGTDILVPAATAVDWVGTWGGWQAVAFAPADYLAPTGDGSLVLRTATGDLTLRPSGPGRVRVGSDAEPWGFVSALGRGSPEGVVTAPAGSDYRNLDGGAGSTLWLKRSGSDATGWAALG